MWLAVQLTWTRYWMRLTPLMVTTEGVSGLTVQPFSVAAWAGAAASPSGAARAAAARPPTRRRRVLRVGAADMMSSWGWDPGPSGPTTRVGNLRPEIVWPAADLCPLS